MSDRLDQIKQRAAKATPGPWEPCPMRIYIFGPRMEMIADSNHDGNEFRLRGVGGKLPMDENIDFIAHSRADVEWLVSEVERLRTELDFNITQRERAEEEVRLIKYGTRR